MKFILGKKLEMSRIFTDDGKVIPVTKVVAGPCFVTMIKTEERDGYQAVQVGFDKKRKLSRALQGHLKNLANFRYLREFRVDDISDFNAGDEISLNSFAPGDKVKVVGTSKGKGFQGVVKRHGFHGSPASHGHKDQLRMPGSIGATDAARVFKGTRMGGHMGNARVTVTNLEVVKVDEANNLLYLKGAIPGARGTLLMIESEGDIQLIKPKLETKAKDNLEKNNNTNSVDEEKGDDKAGQKEAGQEKKDEALTENKKNDKDNKTDNK
jgi:large subunit ribosomal protein L3